MCSSAAMGQQRRMGAYGKKGGAAAWDGCVAHQIHDEGRKKEEKRLGPVAIVSMGTHNVSSAARVAAAAAAMAAAVAAAVAIAAIALGAAAECSADALVLLKVAHRRHRVRGERGVE